MEHQDLQHRFILDAIRQDAAFAGRTMGTMADPGVAKLTSTLSLGLVPFLCLYVYESQRKLGQLGLTTPAMSSAASSVVTRSRHSLKLFEDTLRGVDGLLGFMEDELMPAHKEHFFGNTWFPPARALECDLGLFWLDRRLVTTSHVATIFLGVPPKKLLSGEAGPELREWYAECGRHLAACGSTLVRATSSFAWALRKSRPRLRDKKSAETYVECFNGAATPTLNALLTTLQSVMNFSAYLLSLEADELSRSPVFKLQYLTVYQVIRSLQILLKSRRPALTTGSVSAIEDIVADDDAQLLVSAGTRPFRNTLMHYEVDSRFDMMKLDPRLPFYGLVSQVWPTKSFDELEEVVRRKSKTTADRLSAWSGLTPPTF